MSSGPLPVEERDHAGSVDHLPRLETAGAQRLDGERGVDRLDAQMRRGDRAKFVERSLRNELAQVHHRNVSTDLFDLAEQMAGKKHRRAVGREFPHEVADLAGALGVHAVRRLVENQQLARSEQGVRETQPLAHAERVRLVLLVGRGRESDAGEGLGHALTPGRPLRFGSHGVEPGQVLTTREPRVERGPVDQRPDGWQDES